MVAGSDSGYCGNSYGLSLGHFAGLAASFCTISLRVTFTIMRRKFCKGSQLNTDIYCVLVFCSEVQLAARIYGT